MSNKPRKKKPKGSTPKKKPPVPGSDQGKAAWERGAGSQSPRNPSRTPSSPGHSAGKGSR